MATICIGTSNTLNYFLGGGHLWVFLNWVLGFRRLGFRVIWADLVDVAPVEETVTKLRELRNRLAPFGLADNIALIPQSGQTMPRQLRELALSDQDAASADLLFSFRYNYPPEFIARFKRSCIFEVDPGIIQVAIAQGHFDLSGYGVHLTNSPAVARGTDPAFECGLKWEYLATGVCVEEWKVLPPPPAAAFTTISQWWVEEYMPNPDGTWYRNDKREGFVPFLDLPQKVPAPLELAINLDGYLPDQKMLEERGWRVRESHSVSSTPLDYQSYIQNSLGELSCAKPSYVKMKTGWISDRTVCYLASGRPCVVQNTGDIDLPEDGPGLLRFATLEQAADMIGDVVKNYPRHSRAARDLAETKFSITRRVPRLLQRMGM
jgi:hypothetical protein